MAVRFFVHARHSAQNPNRSRALVCERQHLGNACLALDPCRWLLLGSEVEFCGGWLNRAQPDATDRHGDGRVTIHRRDVRDANRRALRERTIFRRRSRNRWRRWERQPWTSFLRSKGHRNRTRLRRCQRESGSRRSSAGILLPETGSGIEITAIAAGIKEVVTQIQKAQRQAA